MKTFIDSISVESESRPPRSPDTDRTRIFGGARLLEFHDQEWFPKDLRDYVTDALQFALSLGRVYRPVVPRLNQAIQASGTERVMDLCSGGGGPWLWLFKMVGEKSGPPMEVCLTDKYPNIAAFETAREVTSGQLTFFPDPVRAKRLPQKLRGFRTIFTSFHHFSPDEAVAILQNAADQRQGIGVFEAVRRHPLTILMTTLMPLGGLIAGLFLRPFKWSRFFWTFVIPVIPFVLYFDGVVSCLRAYSQKELWRLVEKVKAEDYVWQVGEEPGGFTPVTYLVGYPQLR
jgi:hypothetical protein